MQLSVTGKHVDVGANLSAHASATVQTLVDRYFGAAIDGRVTLERGRHGFRADIQVHVGRSLVVRSHGEGVDAYEAFDNATSRLETRLSRHKGRLIDRHRISDDDASVSAAHLVLDGHGPLSDGPDGKPAIVAEERTELAALNVGEAVARMDLGNLDVFVFINRSHNGLNVIYRRRDGTIGWIDPGAAAAERR
jgi:ribosomal subunit interface protein